MRDTIANYMDQLSVKLKLPILGEILHGGKLVNHLCYADDIYLISLSSVGMQHLYNICYIYAKEHDLLYMYNGGTSYPMTMTMTMKMSLWSSLA